MRLFKNSETGVADWFVKTSSPTLPSITSEEASRIVSMPPAMNEDLLDAEMTVVEKCASVKRPYFYNRAWDARSVASLREMCLACNCTMCETSPDDETAKAKAAKTKEETKTAMSKVSSTLTSASGMVIPSSSMKIDLGDTFHLDSVKERPAKADWQKNSAAQKLEKPNTMAGAHSIAKIGGGEDFFLSPHLFTKPGQNSVTNPMAIQALAESKEDSPKQKLVKDKEDKEMESKAEKTAKYKDITAKMKMADGKNVQLGKVFATESLNAQPGIHNPGTTMKLMQQGLKAIPDQTAGEKIAGQNKEHVASIQKQASADRSWDAEKAASTFTISDSFYDSLKKRMGSTGK